MADATLPSGTGERSAGRETAAAATLIQRDEPVVLEAIAGLAAEQLIRVRAATIYAGLVYGITPTQLGSLLSKSAADFLRHRGQFDHHLATAATAFLSTG